MFTHPENPESITQHDVRVAHPEISFPPTISIEHVAELGYLPIEYDDQPELEPNEIAEPGEIRIEDGRALQSWVVVQLPPPPRHITRLAFLSRFTDEEAIAIDLASIGTTIEAAMMRRYLSKVEAASFIDLEREDTRQGVLALESVGILAEGRALEVLDNPVEPHEVPQ
ncbi:MAG: hypothetical protein GX771_04245 [Halomonadaceae bacterium]|nr:hypothetical protein [Halomonadaceae bacterium]